ncbi:MAG: Mrp/NBP35 family ATP-binding protein [Phycisphaerae bacterium]|nr:Mrp/NBP35 family ATP-binding protein [Phycisphaerae bacterium]
MSLTKELILAELNTIAESSTGRGLVESGRVAKCSTCDGHVNVVLSLPGLDDGARAAVAQRAGAAVRRAAERAGQALVAVAVDTTSGPAPAARTASVSLPQATPARQGAPAARTAQQAAPLLPDVRHIIAVGAGKGGVGKSTVAANLAVGLALRGHAVGLLDGDIYGPSLPTMMGLHSLEPNVIGNMLQPFLVHGVKAMTIGKLVDAERPLIWRGPMAHGAFKQLIEQTEWGPLDYLVVDLPPGTGDVCLSLAQLLRLTGAVVVCTPQRVAQDDAVRALRMFQQLSVEILGVVENMSYFVGDDGKEYDIFGRGGAQMMAQRTGVPFLGSIPITMDLRRNSDEGNPSANFRGGSALARSLDGMVQNLEAQVALAGVRSGHATPTLTIN